MKDRQGGDTPRPKCTRRETLHTGRVGCKVSVGQSRAAATRRPKMEVPARRRRSGKQQHSHTGLHSPEKRGRWRSASVTGWVSTAAEWGPSLPLRRPGVWIGSSGSGAGASSSIPSTMRPGPLVYQFSSFGRSTRDPKGSFFFPSRAGTGSRDENALQCQLKLGVARPQVCHTPNGLTINHAIYLLRIGTRLSAYCPAHQQPQLAQDSKHTSR